MRIESGLAASQKMGNAKVQKDRQNEEGFKAMLEKAFNEKDKVRLKEACRQMESLFLGSMYKQMKGTIPQSDFLPKSFARKTFETMLDDEFAKEASKGQGVGLAQMLYEQLSKEMDNTYKSSGDSSALSECAGEEIE